mgnify:CR=1 FL=1
MPRGGRRVAGPGKKLGRPPAGLPPTGVLAFRVPAGFAEYVRWDAEENGMTVSDYLRPTLLTLWTEKADGSWTRRG